MAPQSKQNSDLTPTQVSVLTYLLEPRYVSKQHILRWPQAIADMVSPALSDFIDNAQKLRSVVGMRRSESISIALEKATDSFYALREALLDLPAIANQRSRPGEIDLLSAEQGVVSSHIASIGHLETMLSYNPSMRRAR